MRPSTKGAAADIAPSRLALLLAVLFASLAIGKHEHELCPFKARHGWLQHCASAEDCTSDELFCSCCQVYGDRTEWAEACTVFCGESVFVPIIASAAERKDVASRNMSHVKYISLA